MVLTEQDLHNMVKEAVMALRESLYGFDESGIPGGFDEADDKEKPEKRNKDDDGRPNDSDSEAAQRKRSIVLDTLRNYGENDEVSNVKRRNIIYKLYNVSDEDDYDTYRSLFSKCLNPEDSSHQFSDAQINVIYNMISNIV